MYDAEWVDQYSKLDGEIGHCWRTQSGNEKDEALWHSKVSCRAIQKVYEEFEYASAL